MDRNTLVAFMLSMLVVSAWLSWEAARQDVGKTGGPAPVTELAEGSPEATADSHGDVAPKNAEPERAPDQVETRSSQPAPVAVDASKDVAEWSEKIDGEVFRVEVTNRGAGITGWELLDYRVDSRVKDSPPINLVTRKADSPPLFATPLEDLGVGSLATARFEVESATDREVVFRFVNDEVDVRKVLRFDPDSYVAELELAVRNRSNGVLHSDLAVLWPAAKATGNDFREQSLIAYVDEKVERTRVESVGSGGFFGGMFGGGAKGEAQDFVGAVEWAGVDTRYFVSALLPESADADVRFEPNLIGSSATTRLASSEVEIRPDDTVVRRYRAFLGPKLADDLAAVGSHLDRSINLGYSWLEPLTLFFHWFLNLLYSVIPNYGVAIILVTIIVRTVTLPIMAKQMKSMEKMRTLQPKIKELQERYKEDRQRQSEEMMKLYKEEGANPLGGCLPMLLQFPVFIGLFYGLQSTIELRHAPFMLWITDLSAPEELFTLPGIDVPIRVLPLAMGASMVLQQRMTPTAGMDPAQARMMTTIMPIMMTVLFYQFPSGLVLYWFVSNLLGIAHQLYIRRNMEA